MREKLRIFLNQPLCRFSIFTSGLLILGQFIFLLFTYSSLPPEVPLFYSLPWGAKQLVPLSLLFILPLSSLIILILNSILVVVTFSPDLFLARMLFFSSTLISLLSLFGLVRIVLLFV